ncbi:hypothetical protein GCM10008018_58850 [Paenibacillus marchantiophytorum]|uniref:Fibronectin type-III domain-containing protein n=1 Tax=Paenibacillus marchantiophytorum TaxID=1619310 RepID=A0ABQ1FAR7_9BACL|nr:hypothetical protein [Paenibacillus marchantiophytorum]GGA05073.1 hypothetical protein GCM10008018_58850 [Paenibacillus marchantiophytorum]
MKKIVKFIGSITILTVISLLMLTPVFAANEYSQNKIPAMTTATLPSGIVTASSELAGTNAWKAFDGNSVYQDTAYHGWGTPQKTGWLAYEFTSSKIISKYVLSHSNQWWQTLPKDWTFEGWNGSSWIILDTRSGITDWVTNTVKEFTFNNTNSYSKYRINVTANNGSVSNTNNLIIVELQMMEKLQSVPSAPLTLSAIGGDSIVNLEWSPSVGATGYNIKRSTTIGGPYTTIATSVTQTTYADTTVTNGTTYYYVVTAVNSAGESINSNEASAKPTAPISQTRVILKVTLINGLEQEYNLSKLEFDAYLSWFDTRSVGTGPAKYTFDNQHLNGPFSSRKNSVVFDKIMKFDYDEYAIDGSKSTTEITTVTNGVVLTLTLQNGTVEEIILSNSDFSSFATWYDSKTNGTGLSRYTFTNPLPKGPFLNRSNVVIFDKITEIDIDTFGSTN